jgi:hypothetical protein
MYRWLLVTGFLLAVWLSLGIQGNTGSFERFLLFTLPILIIATATGTLMYFVHGRTLRGLWNGQPALSRPTRAAITNEGIIFTDNLATHRYAWLAILAFQETTNLFLLYVSDYAFHIIPKRAFISIEATDDFRHILDVYIGSRPNAFPVLPLPPLAVSSDSPKEKAI